MDIDIINNINPKIILCDSDINIDELKTTIQNQRITKIISFDFATHKQLLENNIEHEISDCYLSSDELRSVQLQSYIFAQNWCKIPEINDVLTYNKINLGHLFYVEFHYLIVPFLKQFIETIKIFQRHKDATFFATQNLYDIVISFSNSVNLIPTVVSEIKLLYDNVSYSLKLGRKKFKITLSRSTYSKLKNISEKFLNIILQHHTIDIEKKNVLLAEFDTIKYSNLLTNGLQNHNLIFLGRRRPVFWNFKSFQIIKNANCYLSSNLLKQKKSSNNKKNDIIDKFTKLIQHNETIFLNFFSYENYSFWLIIKKQFLELCTKRIVYAVDEIDYIDRFFNKYLPIKVLILGENDLIEQILIATAKKYSATIILHQHGFYFFNISESVIKFLEFASGFPLNSDMMTVWGDETANFLIQCGIEKSKIHKIGSPAHDRFFQAQSLDSEMILFATSSPEKNQIHDLTVETMENYFSTVKQVCQVVSKLKKKLVIKLHPFSGEIDVTDIAKSVNPDIEVVKDVDILPLIQKCHVFITVDISTTILEAQILKKPVISLAVKNRDWGVPNIFTSGCAILSEKNKFEKDLLDILENTDFRKNIINKSSQLVEKTFINCGDSHKKMLTFLDD